MKLFFAVLAIVFAFLNAHAEIKKPKLVLVLVYDQFRADMLTRFQNQFQKKGFRYLMENGAYYPYAEYEVLQCMTCPGHAMILTGSYPYQNGIPLNEWIDPQSGNTIYCAEDSEFGLSPKRLKATSVGDELKMASAQSKVVTVALKDRSAIMLGGKNPNLALWLDHEKMQWETSGYYKNTGNLDWLKTFNQKTSKLLGTEVVWKPTFIKEKFEHKAQANTNNALGFPFGTVLTQNIAIEALKKMKLGQSNATDLFAVSFSSHDLNGHGFGPNSPENEEMTLSEDYYLAQFLKEIDQQVGLKNTWIILTADHGVAPGEEFAKAHGIDAGKIDTTKLVKGLSQELDQKFGAPKNNKWFAGFSSLNLYFTSEVMEQYENKLPEVQSFAKKYILKQPGVAYVMTSDEYQKRLLPPEIHGRQAMKSYLPGTSGDLMIISKPFWIPQGTAYANHITGYAYDRTVPLLLTGSAFKKGIYAQSAKVVDLAPTLTFLLGTIPPSLSEGRVLSEAVKP